VRGVTVTGTGATQSQVEYQEVGIILQVTPHINPDGFVNLEVKPEISNITPSTVTITEGLQAPIFNKRAADTTVIVKDGETIVIGGLIQHRDEETENKVPILGDIPYLGIPFRATTKNKRKSELLIILTPQVVRTVEDARAATLKVRDQHSFPEESMQSDLWENLREVPGEEGMGPPPPPAEPQVGPPQPLPVPPPEGQEYKPTPKVYGPALPRRLGSGSGLVDQTSVVGPPLYEDYLRQRR